MHNQGRYVPVKRDPICCTFYFSGESKSTHTFLFQMHTATIYIIALILGKNDCAGTEPA